MYREKKLEDHILHIYSVRGNAELHWSQIRNELKSNAEISEKDRLSEGLSVKLSRALYRLCDDQWLKRKEYGHRDVRYFLTEIGEKKLSSRNILLMNKNRVNWGAGCYTPGCSFEDYVKRMKQQWMELFDKEFTKDELRFDYEAVKARALGIPQVMHTEMFDEE